MPRRDWVIDTTDSPSIQQSLLKFIHIDVKDKKLHTNTFCLSKHCPGNLVGIINFKGVPYLNSWILNNPGWFLKHRNKE